MKILVVDDTRIILSVVEAILNQDHHEVYTAADGRAGYTAFYDVLPDLILTDIEMPWQDGLSMMQTIRLTHPEVYTIYMTGNPGPYQQSLDLECATYPSTVVYKPFTRNALLRAVSNSVHQRPMTLSSHRPPIAPRGVDQRAAPPVNTQIASLSAASFQGEHRHEKTYRVITGSRAFDGIRTGSGR